MRFEITLDGKTYPAAYIGKTARLYREQFGKDLMMDVADATAKFLKEYTFIAKEGVFDVSDNDVFLNICVKAAGPETLERMLWVSICSANDGVPSFQRWLDEIEDYRTAIAQAAIVFQMMAGNVPTVETEEKEEESNEQDKKK